MRRSLRIRYALYLIPYTCFLLLLSGCANQLPPGGGPPDKTPPKIVDVYPANGTTNFSGDYVQFDFSKYIDKSTLKNALFISPAIEGDMNFDWTGTSVKISFPAALKKNVTYVMTVGTDLQDYYNHNRMVQSYTLTFSTGNKIDKGEIEGKVYDEKPEGIMIFAYTVDDSAVNPMKYKPDYISQTGTDGSYQLLGLAPAAYRIFAVRDQYKDLIYQPEQDDIGMPPNDVKLTETDTLVTGLNFFLTKMDTLKPRLISAVMTDKYHILLNFTKEVDTSTINSKNFSLVDSTLKKTFNPVYAFKGNTKPTEMVLVTTADLPVKDEAYVFADSIKDKFGNVFRNDFAKITLSDKTDTTKPGIAGVVPPDNSDKVDFDNPVITFSFNDSFDTSTARKNISLSDTSGLKYPIDVHFIDDASFEILPVQNLKANTDYIIKLDLNGFKDAAGNAYDSVYQYKFKTINGLDFTGVSGTVEGADLAKNPSLILQGIDANKLKYKLQLNGSGNFKFERIQPGKYFLWGYYDTDSSKTYSFGEPLPFKPAERFFFYPDTLNLRARWTVTNIVYHFSDKGK